MTMNVKGNSGKPLVYSDFMYILILSILTFFYIYSSWHVPFSEDSGYYAFLSKEMLNGMVLHNDVPATTNGLLLYFTAAIFKLFGATKITYRLIYACGYILLISSIYNLVRSSRSRHEAFIASCLCAILITIPSVYLDLGRNAIMWSLAMIFIGFHYKLQHDNHFVLGFLLAIAALIRETFLCVAIAYGVILLIRTIVLSIKENRIIISKALLTFGSGVILGLSINVIILSYYHSWNSYFFDMLHSGVSFRYKHPFALKHIKNQLAELHYGFSHFYSPIILFALFSYLFPTKNTLINWLKYFFLPLFFIEAIIINRTTAYSIIPMLTVCGILTTYFWFELINKVRIEKKYRFYMMMFFVIAYSLSVTPKYINNIYDDFSGFYNISARSKNAETKNWATERVATIISNLPTTPNISTNSMYPLLFEIKASVDYRYPYLFDLSAPDNLSISTLKTAQKSAIFQQIPDILVVKNDPPYPPIKDETQNPIYNRYISIADFNESEETTVTKYTTRVFISNLFFHKNYYLSKPITNAIFYPGMNIPNIESNAIIARVTSTPEYCIKAYQLINGLSQATLHTYDAKSPALYALALPNSVIQIKKMKRCDSKLNINIYSRKQMQTYL